MDAQGRFIDWRFSGAELIAGIVSLTVFAVGITLWSVDKFQSKSDAQDMKAQLERRLDRVENDVSSMRTSLDGVAKNVEYIRGRLEPK